MKSILPLVIISIFLTGCSAKYIIDVKQEESHYPIILRANLEENIVWGIRYKWAYTIKNKTHKVLLIDGICQSWYSSGLFDHDEEYNRRWSRHQSNSRLYDYKNRSILYNSRYQRLRMFLKREYVYEIMQRIDTTDVVQARFKPYLQQMKNLGIDTLALGSIHQLKETHPELIYDFIAKDSVCFRIKWKDDDYELELPIEVK